jgi:hypothetical protein
VDEQDSGDERDRDVSSGDDSSHDPDYSPPHSAEERDDDVVSIFIAVDFEPLTRVRAIKVQILESQFRNPCRSRSRSEAGGKRRE